MAANSLSMLLHITFFYEAYVCFGFEFVLIVFDGGRSNGHVSVDSIKNYLVDCTAPRQV